MACITITGVKCWSGHGGGAGAADRKARHGDENCPRILEVLQEVDVPDELIKNEVVSVHDEKNREEIIRLAKIRCKECRQYLPANSEFSELSIK